MSGPESTVEMPVVQPDTTPMRRAEALCGWCEIRLSAVPDAPKPLIPKGSRAIRYYHPGCVSAQRNADDGIVVNL